MTVNDSTVAENSSNNSNSSFNSAIIILWDFDSIWGAAKFRSGGGRKNQQIGSYLIVPVKILEPAWLRRGKELKFTVLVVSWLISVTFS